MDIVEEGIPPQTVLGSSPGREASDVESAEPIISGEKRKRDEPQSDTADSKPDPSLNPLWKTSLCSYFRSQSGSCSHGSGCRYAHGEEELRQRPDNSWDPTSERAKKMMKLSLEPEKKAVMMTEDVIDDTEDDDNEASENGLSKCLVHLPRKWTSEHLKNFLGEQGAVFKSAKKKKGMTVGFISFESAEQLKSAVKELEGKSIGNKNLKIADVIPRTFKKTTNSSMALPQNTHNITTLGVENEENCVLSNEDRDTNSENSTFDELPSKGICARDVATPLANMPYADQLEHKKSSLMQILKRLTRNARKACPTGVALPEWIIKSREIGGLPCDFKGILESPIINGYRNKCEFSVGFSLQGKPTVGFMLGNFREGITAVEAPLDCPNVSSIACKYASIFQDFLQHSELPLWNRFKNEGFWRQLTVREGRSSGKLIDVEKPDSYIDEVMLIIQVNSLGFDNVLVTSEFERLAQAFARGAASNSSPLPLTTLVTQDHQGISNVAPADAPLQSLLIPKGGSPELHTTNDSTEPRIHDHISNLRFCISPTAFFQVNTLAAEKLYSLAGDWAGLGPDTLLFDICCGTGTIGLTLAHRVGMVIGVEMNASAVSDAQRNAEINGIKNCEFVCAKAEDVIGSLLKKYLNVVQKQDVTNVTDGSEKGAATVDKDNAVDEIQDSEEILHNDPENGTSIPGYSDTPSLEKEIQLGGSTFENGSTMQHFRNVVAIVDPPRGGLHPTVTKALRLNPILRRLVYISCNPESLVANAIELCTPSIEKVEKGNRNNRGWRNMGSAGLARQRVKSMPVSEPFRPVKAMAVDLFPHTVHSEMVMLLERCWMEGSPSGWTIIKKNHVKFFD